MSNFRNESGLTFVDISLEIARTYDFGDHQVTIKSPMRLHVSHSGGHRLYDQSGTCHYIPPGWIHLSWTVVPDSPHFVL